jgi:eukaryotic-like serine/threonine-protein kinase
MADSHDVRTPGNQHNNSDAIVPPDLSTEAVREQLARICKSRGFASAESLRRFLNFVVEKTLQGQGSQLKEYLIGVDVFDRGEKFDPRLDSIVRVQGSKLRSKLREYYEVSGMGDPIRIDLPKGSYAPVFRTNSTPVEHAVVGLEPAVTVPARNSGQRIAFACLLVIAAAIAIYLSMTQPRNATTSRTLVRLTYDAGLTIDPTISPDGKLLAYASDRARGSNLDLWVQPVSGGTPLRLTRFSGDVRDPAFSPDGTQLAFTANQDDGGIYLISVFGGEARKIAPRGRRPRFSPDGDRITYWVGTDVYGQIYVAPLSGGGTYRVRPEFNHATFPIWSPDGKYILFFGNRSTETLDADWWLTDVEGKSLKRTGLWKTIVHDHHLEVDMRLFGDWIWSHNYLVFSARQGDSLNLWRIPVLLKSGGPAGPPERVTFGAGQDVLPSIAADGRLVFANIRDKVQVWSVPVRVAQGVTPGELRPLTSDAVSDVWPHLSRDGQKLVFASNRGGDWRIWIKDLKSGQETCLTPAPAKGIVPTISPDGTKVAYGPPFPRNGESVGIYVVASQGGGAVRICEHCGYPNSWSHDQRKLFYTLSPHGNPSWVDVGSGEVHPFLRESSYSIWEPQFSPDDRWVAFAALEHRDYDLFITPFVDRGPVGSGSWLPVTRGPSTDRNPAWSTDGQLLYFLSDRDTFLCVWALRLDRNKRPSGKAFPVIHFHSARRSPANVIQNQFRLSVSIDKLAFNLGELTGDIWMSKL